MLQKEEKKQTTAPEKLIITIVEVLKSDEELKEKMDKKVTITKHPLG